MAIKENHQCTQLTIIQDYLVRLSVLEAGHKEIREDMKSLVDDVKSIQEKINGFTWWFIGLLISIIGGLISTILILKGVK
jgi:hypothetical protein